MSNFCKNCGTQLVPDVKFCRMCGAQTAIIQSAPPTEAPSHSTSASTKDNTPVTSTKSAGRVASAMTQHSGSVIAAPAGIGEVAFNGSLPPMAGTAVSALNPFKVLFSGAWNVARGVGLAFKDKRKWIPALIMAAMWFTLTLLPILGINPQSVRVLSWITFANGGMGGGALSIAGGVLGKGIVAGLVLSLFSGGNPLKSMGSGLKTMFSSFSCKGMGDAGALLCGGGLALICYNFMAGFASLTMTMAGISAFLLSLRALGNSTGFLRSFFGGLTGKKAAGGKIINTSVVNRVIAGIAVGFALSVPLSALWMPYISYALGVLLLITGLILYIAGKTKKEVAAI